jgi:hypothetical protein
VAAGWGQGQGGTNGNIQRCQLWPVPATRITFVDFLILAGTKSNSSFPSHFYPSPLQEVYLLRSWIDEHRASAQFLL